MGLLMQRQLRPQLPHPRGQHWHEAQGHPLDPSKRTVATKRDSGLENNQTAGDQIKGKISMETKEEIYKGGD